VGDADAWLPPGGDADAWSSVPMIANPAAVELNAAAVRTPAAIDFLALMTLSSNLDLPCYPTPSDRRDKETENFAECSRGCHAPGKDFRGAAIRTPPFPRRRGVNVPHRFPTLDTCERMPNVRHRLLTRVCGPAGSSSNQQRRARRSLRNQRWTLTRQDG
jgi:hypothetical protein